MCMNQLSKLYHEVHLKTAHTSVNCWTKCKKKKKRKEKTLINMRILQT